MFSVQNNQVLQQLTQLTCGVVATVTNAKVRRVHRKSPTPQQEKKVLPTATATSSTVPVAPLAALDPILNLNHANLQRGTDANLNLKANLQAFAPEPPELEPLTLSALSKLQSESPQFSEKVSHLTQKILKENGQSWKTHGKNPQLVSQIWREVVHAVAKEEGAVASSVAPTPLQRTTLTSAFAPAAAANKGQISSLSYQPFRTFKTKRDLEAANQRNPSMLTRVKDKFFPGGGQQQGQIQGQAHAQGQALGSVAGGGSDKMKSLIGDSSEKEAEKLKVAFAEGYLASSGGGGGGEKSRTYRWLRTLQQVLAIAVFTAILASLMGSFGGGMFRVSVGNGNEVQPEDINVTFNDVKGVDEAKQELQEIVEFLKNPSRFVALGGKLPKGVLLVGPPGTGKTLLARAVAGEAGVPFFHAAGPEFDEILVGQGARRVRDLFKAAKLKAPCVVFIDEIDSVGAKRTNSVLHPYANQTINQLLSEMDGFRQNEGVIVLGATNRREDLDKALLRPGRFDVEVPVPAPEYAGRVEILEYYLSKVKLGNDVDVALLARGTTGFTGADLENMINQAALKAAIDGAETVGKKHLDFARDKVIMGPQRKNRIPDEETNKITAYHEAGHAIAAYYTKETNPIHKVTIIPRGASLGHTAYIPDKEQYHVTKSQLMALMDTMMGGRAAEELIFGMDKITSGASSDLKQATAIATHMVKEWGMSEKIGLRTVENNNGLVSVNDLGPSTTEQMDVEIRKILQESYERAKTILKLHAKEHKALAEALMMYETLDADDVKAILAGQPPSLTHHKSKDKPPLVPVKGHQGGHGAPGTAPGAGQKRLHPC